MRKQQKQKGALKTSSKFAATQQITQEQPDQENLLERTSGYEKQQERSQQHLFQQQSRIRSKEGSRQKAGGKSSQTSRQELSSSSSSQEKQKFERQRSQSKIQRSYQEKQDLYFESQDKKMSADKEDYFTLQQQIQRVKKIHSENKHKESEIISLKKTLHELKSQNESLRLDRQSEKQNLSQAGNKSQFGENSSKNNPRQKNNVNLFYNIKYDSENRQKRGRNIVEIDSHLRTLSKFKIDPLSRPQRYLSPQINKGPERGILTEDLLRRKSGNFNSYQDYGDEALRKYHQENKRTVINTFIEQLKQDLERNQNLLQNEKKAHRETRQNYENSLQTLTKLRAKLESQYDYSHIVKENELMRRQLQGEAQERLLAEERLREKELMLAHYQESFLLRSAQFEQELDRMDQIYLDVERTLQL